MTACPMPSRDVRTFPKPLLRGEERASFIIGFLSVLITALAGWSAWMAIDEPFWRLVAAWCLLAAGPFSLRLLVTFLFDEDDHSFIA